ncbi:MAG: hypothetical protein JNJ54_30850 [Myxococcaceae bacterium]|nr:hypothetical protein [Myxococcaceae bacterium]
MRTLSVVLGLVAGFVVAVLPSCGAPRCSAATCALGCCDTAGRCQSSSNLSCGANGAACVSCSLSQSCVSGMCTGGAGAGAGGGPSGGGMSGTGGGSSVTGYSAFLDDFSTVYCQKAIECGSLPTTSTADCAAVLRQMFATRGYGINTYLATERSVLAGAATYNATRGQACLAEVAAIPCVGGSPSGNPTSCDGVTSPAAAANGACFSRTDCVDPTLSCNGGPCMRRCTVGGNLGESCRADGSCATPFVCINNTCLNEPAPGSACNGFLGCGPRQECRNSVCVALPLAGASCPDFRCVPDAYCDSSRICRPKKALGTGCQSTGECIEGAVCASLVCSPAGAQGSACRFSSDCQRPLQCILGRCNPQGGSGARCLYSNDCQSPLGCDDVLRICREYTSSQQTGQACSSTQSCRNSNEVCRSKSVTNDGGTGTPGTCGVPQVGDACNGNYECGVAQYCTMPSRQCQAAGPATPCSSASNCRSTDYCTSSNVCATRAASGQACDSTRSESCAAAGERCLTTGGTARCARTPTLGEPCGSECLFPYTCVGGTCAAAGRVGQPCIANSPVPCFTGECLAADGGVGREGTCVAPRGEGAMCQSDVGCLSGYCDLLASLGPQGAAVCVAACR